MSDPSSQLTQKSWLQLIFFGICMGTADIIPGISGGTIAFIMGFYEELLNSIKSINLKSFNQLLRGHYRQFFHMISWKFLLGLTTGIVLAMICLAHTVIYILNHEHYRVLLYATFFGLIIGSSILCGWQLKGWSVSHISIFLMTAIVAFLLTGTAFLQTSPSNSFIQTDASQIFNGWIIFCGAIAISAMLLPGISGSYLLTILGMYPIVLGALADFVLGLTHGKFDMSSFMILTNLLIGIVAGALLFTRCISWLLNRYHDLAIAALTGFMVGALRSVWPFWTYEYKLSPLTPEKGPQLGIVDAILPNFVEPYTWVAIALALLGASAVFILNSIAQKKKNTYWQPSRDGITLSQRKSY